MLLLFLTGIGCTSKDGDEGAVVPYQGRAVLDTDGDGVLDPQDVCVATPDPEQLDADGDGVGNACDRPIVQLVGLASPGAWVELVATAAPGEQVRFGGVVGAGGRGPCPAFLGGLCLDLGPGATDLGAAVAAADGLARLPFTVPAAVRPNGTYLVQAAIARGADSVSSRPLVVDGTTLDWDADGLTDATEVGLGTDPTLTDTDGDGLGDAEEVGPAFDPLDPDTDGDGALDGADLCPGLDDATPDPDADGIPAACDNCRTDANPGQTDGDRDGLGDACEGSVLVSGGWSVESNQDYADLGTSVASAGDVNGDGFDDVVVGTPGYADGQPGEGVVTLHLGSAAGLAVAPAWTAQGDAAGASIGYAVASGDVNGDGFGDVVVGAPRFTMGQTYEGAARLYLGSAAGLSGAPAWTVQSDVTQAFLGLAVALLDVNGDGFDDVALGAPDEILGIGAGGRGHVHVYLGSAAGPGAAPAWTATGPAASSAFGTAVASAGDVDGDGFDDLIVGAPDMGIEGAAYLYLGSPGGLSAAPDWEARGRVEGVVQLFDFGSVVASAGDPNGDGFDDVVVTNTNHARAWVYPGSASGLAAEAAWIVEGAWTAASAGDVNGDGFDDLLTSDVGLDIFEYDPGTVTLFLGSPAGLAASPAFERTTGQQVRQDQFGSVADPVCYGAGLGGAGDVNGDGLADVLISAPYYNAGQRDEGKAWLYLGASP